MLEKTSKIASVGRTEKMKNRKSRFFDRGIFIFMIAYQFLEQTVQNPRTTLKKLFFADRKKPILGTVFEGKW